MADSELSLLTHQSNQIAFLATPTMGYTGRNAGTNLIVDEAEPAVFVDPVIMSFAFTGYKDVTFFDDFYFRIHVIPNSLDLGNILSVQTETVTIWNAYLSPKVINDFLAPAVTGLSIQQPVTVPYTMSSLEEVRYIVTVAASGPPQFADTLQWTIDSVVYDVSVSGRRVVVWPFRPNWNQPVREALQWRTDILTSFNETEDRLAVYSQPRLTLTYSMSIQAEDVQLFHNLLFGWQNRQYAVPLWQDGQAIGQLTPAGVTSIPVETAGRAFAPEGLVLIMTDAQVFEVVQIDAVNALSIQLKKATELTWPATAQVYPLIQAILPTNVPSQQLTSKVLQATVRFAAIPADNTITLSDEAPEMLVDGTEVVLRKPNWASPVTVDHRFTYDIQDYGTGTFRQIQRPVEPRRVQRMSWTMFDRVDVARFRGLLKRMQGRYSVMFVPTWLADFTIVDPIALNTAAIRVKSTAYAAMVGVAPSQNMLMIRRTDGTFYIREIVGASASDNNTEVISLAESIPVAIPLNNIMQVCLVHLARSQSDAFEITHLTKGKAVASVQYEVVTQ